jgi:F-type H+-transporting ATPase subunit epsilon
MTTPMQLQVITPDNKVLDTFTEYIRVYLPDGWWGILPGHAPMISQVFTGVVHYIKDEQTRFVALYEGTIEVQKETNQPIQVIILTSAAEEGSDLAAVQSSLEQQAVRLIELAREADIEFKQIRLSLEKALQRINLSEKSL